MATSATNLTVRLASSDEVSDWTVGRRLCVQGLGRLDGARDRGTPAAKGKRLDSTSTGAQVQAPLHVPQVFTQERLLEETERGHGTFCSVLPRRLRGLFFAIPASYSSHRPCTNTCGCAGAQWTALNGRGCGPPALPKAPASQKISPPHPQAHARGEEAPWRNLPIRCRPRGSLALWEASIRESVDMAFGDVATRQGPTWQLHCLGHSHPAELKFVFFSLSCSFWSACLHGAMCF